MVAMEMVRSNQDIDFFFHLFLFMRVVIFIFFFHSRYILSEIDELYVGYD